ncbi:MAG: DUF2071 domain-containing protein [Bacteroidota bacterium]
MSFLTAEWRKLAIANYEIDDAILKPFIPARTELDTWNGINYVSLIGFLFVDTRLLGMTIPFHSTFEEVNLRFYVRFKENNEWKRGVVFIKEIVPKFAISLVANTLYHEHYETQQMKHSWENHPSFQRVQYQWKHRDQWQSMSVDSALNASPILMGTEEAFITEHYWGYTKVNANTTFEYEVRHPTWEAYQIKQYQIEIDFGLVYGEVFGGLNQAEPKSVMLAEGSAISVENKRKI